MALNCVLDGHALMLLRKSILTDYLQKGLLVAPFMIEHPDKLNRYLVYNKASHEKLKVKVFSDWLKKELAQSRPF